MKAAKLFALVFSGLVIAALGACATHIPKVADGLAVQEKPEALSEKTHAEWAKTEPLKGRLVLFGTALDSWLGLRDAQGQVVRLVFDSPSDFATHRLLQNQTVKIWGLPLPPVLGRPQWLVIRLQKMEDA